MTALGCLFTSFATQFHQLFLSYGLVKGFAMIIQNSHADSNNLGVGVGMARDAATLMVGQYFKRRRELVRAKILNTDKLLRQILGEYW